MSLMDLFPSLLDIAGVSPDSTGLTLDGHSHKDDLLGTSTTDDSDDILFFYCLENLVAARAGPYKVHFRATLFQDDPFGTCTEGFPNSNTLTKECPETPLDPWLVYNVDVDPGEFWPLSVDYLSDDVVSKLNSRMVIPDEEMRDPLLVYSSIRSNLSPCCNAPYCFCQ